ncbi:TonB-dependent receptor [Echinicola shivajiensis]|uniref:TonB-dependent receptor n=1 Tax=Echinicola shivajiensis TaxID=1035916 RepID=UPI001BFCD5E7|nr:TonB-dependent receptor [Echinicola shivajiensis]
MRKLLLRNLLTVLMILGVLNMAWAQGVTTASMQGVVTDASGETLPGANIVAIHSPSGTKYGVSTRIDGRFTIQGMRVGGPYIVEVSYIGFETVIIEDINLRLGQAFSLDVMLQEEGIMIEGVEVLAVRNPVMNDERTGAATSISNEQLNSLPSISRGLNDFTRLTPQASTAGDGISFAGQNNRYNQFAIDGTVNNDVFGLSASGTNGGQTGVQPISLDAIEQVQVVIAPYDVRQGGFTGGGINAITRSGNNEFQGSVYYYFNNESLVGKSPDEERTRLDSYSDYQTGFRLGGPIIKDKLFFFANGEVTSRTQPLLYRPGTSNSNISVEEMERVQAVANRLGYEPGPFGEYSNETNSEKIFARLDWNINQNNKLTLRHSYVFGENIDGFRSPNEANFYNYGEYFPSTTNSTVLELNSNFRSDISNELRIGYTTVRDDRNYLGDPFPTVNVRLGGGRSINFGSEPFSTANQLDQDVLTITDNLTFYKGKNTITVGTHNEFYKTYNLFIRQNFGAYSYHSLEDFETVGTAAEILPRSYDYSYSRTDNPLQGAEFNAYQLGFYVQDEYQASRDLKITAGIRLDIPTFSEEPSVNTAFNEAFAEYDVATDQMPGSQLMISPRVGVNWDVNGDGTTQVRGGIGLFTGRVPFVWLSNQYTNTGNEFARISLFRNDGSLGDFEGREDFTFVPDPYGQPDAEDLNEPLGISEVNVTDKDFKFPQVFRLNGAIDHQFPGGIIGTFEAIYTKNLKNIDFKNLNIMEDGTLEGGPDNRTYFNGFINDNFNNVILLTNTDKGYAYNLTGQFQKFFEGGLSLSAAYTYGQSKDVNGGTSSQAFSNWRYVENVNGGNNPGIGFADNDIRSRVIASVNYRIEYQNGSATTIGLFYNGQSGIPVSYVYDGDINNDRTFGNDLIYVPANSGEINFTGTPEEQTRQWDMLNSFIEGNDYLKSRRGDYVERNGDRLPWTNQVDMRFMHEFQLKTVGDTNHRLQFSFDVFNLGNLISKEWGRQYSVNNNSFSLINFDGYEDGTKIPTYSYDGSGLSNGNPYFVSDFLSRWRGQVGIRYIFD